MTLRDAHELRAENLTLGYTSSDVIAHLDVDIPTRKITMIVGANASGKSTLLRGLARLLAPRGGQVTLDGRAVQDMKTVDVAKVLGLLPQEPVAPDGITVGDLVGRGRYPHQGWFRRWSSKDDQVVATALAATGTADLVDRRVAELSGGQRQRVWVAMALAQDTDLLLLDEPTTHLDISHQVDLLDLLTDLNRTSATTIVVVLHDLNLACRYADHLIAMKDGAIVAEGSPVRRDRRRASQTGLRDGLRGRARPGQRHPDDHPSGASSRRRPAQLVIGRTANGLRPSSGCSVRPGDGTLRIPTTTNCACAGSPAPAPGGQPDMSLARSPRPVYRATNRPRGSRSLLIAIATLAVVASMLPLAPAAFAAGNQAIQIDGVDTHGITLGTNGSLGASTFTLELWFKRTGNGTATLTGSSAHTDSLPLITKGRSENDGGTTT